MNKLIKYNDMREHLSPSEIFENLYDKLKKNIKYKNKKK